MPTTESVPAVSRDSSAYFPSTWRQPTVKPLSSRRIGQYALVGRYGPQAKRIELRKIAKRKNRVIAKCVGCGTEREVLYRTYEYLEKKGHWCNRCIETIRSERDKEKELARRIRAAHEKMMAEVFV